MQPHEFEMSKSAVMSVKDESKVSLRDQAHGTWREIVEESYRFSRHAQELSTMNHLDLLSIRTFYRRWIHSKASERRCLVISIGPDPILNKLEHPGVCHWTLNQLDDFRSQIMTPAIRKLVPKEWFHAVFENSDYLYPPPFVCDEDENLT